MRWNWSSEVDGREIDGILCAVYPGNRHISAARRAFVADLPNGPLGTIGRMTTYVALLRAVNVGGTSKLPMARLKAMCEDAGLIGVRTYIASGNVVFESRKGEAAIKAALETRLEAHAGKPVGVLIRTAAEIGAVLDRNPFPDKAAKWTVAIFLDEPPPADALDDVRGRADEEIAPGVREIYVHYPSGIGRSKLKIRAAAPGTARNMNTVAELAEMAGGRG